MATSERGLDPKFLQKTTQDLIEALTSPAYVAAVQAVRDAPEESRLVEASQRLTPDGLRKQGVPIPSDMRITSRYFETGFPNAIDVEIGDPPAGGVNLVNALNEAKPGLLDSLRINNPEIYKALIAQNNEALAMGSLGSLAYCNCGGHTFTGPFGVGSGTVCGGAGGHLL